MKAIVCTKYGPPEVLLLKEVRTPTPKPGEICIKVFATAVTSSDCFIRGFHVSWQYWLPMAFAIGFTKPRQPILGIVFAGEVASTGKEVRQLKQGDQVFGWDLFPGFGAYAEYKCLSQKSMVTHKPTTMTYEEAAAVPYGGLMALASLRKGHIESGQKILIYGASGAVGTSAVQIARHLGATVTGVCGPTNLDLVRSLGADAVIDYTQGDFTAGSATYDFVFDAVGKRRSAKVPLKKLCAKDGLVVSVDDGSPKIRIEDLVLLKELAEAGKIKPVIDRRYPLAQIADAHRYVEEGHKKGNVVITIEHSPSNLRA